MGRSKGKGKKPTVVSPRTDSGEEEKMPARRRGRPLKIVKDNIGEKEETEKIVVEDGETTNNSESNEEMGTQILMENDQKRMKSTLENDQKENGDAVKFVSFRQTGSRRKSKPRRAAEVGVECW